MRGGSTWTTTIFDRMKRSIEKINPNAVLKNLPPEKQQEIMDYLDGTGTSEPHSFEKTAEWLQASGIETSTSALKRFRPWFVIREAMEISEIASKEMVEECKKNGWIKTRKEEEAAGQIFFNRETVEQRNARLWALVQGISLRRDRLELDKRKLKLTEELHAQTKEITNNTQMTTEEKEERIRQIMGLE
jgi:hypothetical protein